MKKVVEITVKSCRDCPFFGGHKILECCHPYFDDKGAYDNLIIERDNSIGKVPALCPLRLDEITTIRTVKLDTKLRSELNQNKDG